MQPLTIPSQDYQLAATLFESESPRGVLVIASATGVKQSYYRRFATYLATHHLNVITFDYRGIGGSLNAPIKTLNHGAADWGRHDLERVLQYAYKTYPQLKKYLVGHSIGGQLVGLAPSSVHLDKVVLVAAQSGYWKLWNGMGRVQMWFNWHVLFPPLISLFGYLPSKKISGMENLPKNVARQWSGWGKKRNYILDDISLEQTVYANITVPITAFSIDDDGYAPPKAVEWMCNTYSNAPVKRVHLVPKAFNTKKIGHFGVFKERFKEQLWPLLLAELA